MFVRDVMTTDVATATLDTSLPDLVDLMVNRDISGIPVLGGDGHVVGVVTDADIVARHARGAARPPRQSVLSDLLRGHRNRWWQKAAGMTAGEIMTTPAHTIGPDDPLHSAASKMLSLGIKRLPVVDDQDRLVGIVSRRDLLRLFHRTDEVIAADVRDALDDPLRCPEEHGVRLTCVASGVVYLNGWTLTVEDADAIESILRTIPGVIDVRGGIGRHAPLVHHAPS